MSELEMNVVKKVKFFKTSRFCNI